ncbi:hypothetical protein [Azohydromonas lata]|uniref:hypothetical protein n=1 Tax=Azohydromonas lata TaxID=45677 RepID=UPI0012F4F17A|nr:hypothetical protein [Azohydromonas lata]
MKHLLPSAVRSSALRLALAVAGLSGGLACIAPNTAAAQGGEGDAQALRARLSELEPRLASSPFGRPLLLQSNDSTSAPLGEVWAVLDQPFDAVAGALRQPRHWCDILLLQTNVKRCAPSAGEGAAQQLEVGVARRYTDPVDEAQSLAFRFAVPARQDDFFAVALLADQGPLGTQNYRLRLQAVPAPGGRTFMHMSYAYEMGLAARLATSAYLASAGRDKVGFSVVDRDEQGHAQFVRGMQGVAERNTMRYFLAIDSFVATASAPVQERLRRFHAALERYPAQLHETTQAEYLTMKQREVLAR